MKGSIAKKWREALSASVFNKIYEKAGIGDGQETDVIYINAPKGKKLIGMHISAMASLTASAAENANAGKTALDATIKSIRDNTSQNYIMDSDMIRYLGRYFEGVDDDSDIAPDFGAAGSATIYSDIIIPFFADTFIIKSPHVTDVYPANVTKSVSYTIYAIYAPADMFPEEYIFKENNLGSITGQDITSNLPTLSIGKITSFILTGVSNLSNVTIEGNGMTYIYKAKALAHWLNRYKLNATLSGIYIVPANSETFGNGDKFARIKIENTTASSMNILSIVQRNIEKQEKAIIV